MGTVFFSCPFVPVEWIAAHGRRPHRLRPRAPGAGVGIEGAREGVCPFASAFAQSVLSEAKAGVDGIVMTTACDQMRRMAELVDAAWEGRVFLMHVPATWRTEGARRYYGDELRRLGRFLVSLGGRDPSPEELTSAMLEYDHARSVLRDSRRRSGRSFAEAVYRVYRGEAGSGSDEGGEQSSENGVPVGLVGSPLREGDLALFDTIESMGGTVVLDGTTHGERALPRAFDRARTERNPFEELVHAYFVGIPDAFRRPNALLYDWLAHEIEGRGIRGVIFRSYLWCDTWRAEAQRMREFLPVPVLDLEAGDEAGVTKSTASRIEAFLEVLR